MEKQILKLKLAFYAPTIIGVIRLLYSMYVLVVNPQGMGIRFLQLIPMCILIVYLFLYNKLYSDGVPVITLMVPTILHAVFVWVFLKRLQLEPFALVFILDILFLICKSIKASYFPFVIEGEESDNIEELLSEVE